MVTQALHESTQHKKDRYIKHMTDINCLGSLGFQGIFSISIQLQAQSQSPVYILWNRCYNFLVSRAGFVIACTLRLWRMDGYPADVYNGHPEVLLNAAPAARRPVRFGQRMKWK